MKQPSKPSFIANWREIEAEMKPPVTNETFGFASEFSPATGMTHLRTAHFRLPPGTRGYPPIAMKDDEIFAFVLEGEPDLWIDGYLHTLRLGDGIALNAGTGIAHTLLNNTQSDVRIFMMGEAPRYGSKGVHPVDALANENLKAMGKHWDGAPKRKLGPHDGLTDAQRGSPSPKSARKRGRPDFVANWREILEKKSGTYPGSEEEHGLDALFGRRARFSRIGVHMEVLKPGRRTSWPHAERDEEEFVFVVRGNVDAWNDGWITPLGEGDLIGWPAGTGITHVVINNSDEDAFLIVGGEASRARNQYWYPFHSRRNKEIGALYWHDHPVPKLGPHDGMPDALRAKLKPVRRAKPKAKSKKRR